MRHDYLGKEECVQRCLGVGLWAPLVRDVWDRGHTLHVRHRQAGLWTQSGRQLTKRNLVASHRFTELARMLHDGALHSPAAVDICSVTANPSSAAVEGHTAGKGTFNLAAPPPPLGGPCVRTQG